MAPKKPKAGDRAIYRGRFREIVGFRQDAGAPIEEKHGPRIVLTNPETGRHTIHRTRDMRWSEYLGAWYAVGLILSREECCVYAALPGTPGKTRPDATAHEAALRLLDTEDLSQELDEEALERLERQMVGYWPETNAKGERTGKSTKTKTEVWETAAALRAHRQEVMSDG